MEMEEMIDKFKELMPNIKINTQPETSLKKLLEYEKEYSMNTEDALELYIKLDEEVHHDDRYKYLCQWVSELSIYRIHKGDKSLINHINN